MQLNGAIFGLAYYEIARRSSRDRRRLAIELALAEHMTLFSTGMLVDRYHPARGEPGVAACVQLHQRSPRQQFGTRSSESCLAALRGEE